MSVCVCISIWSHIHYINMICDEREWDLSNRDFRWIWMLFLASIFCVCWYSLSVQTRLCGRSAIRCASLTAQIIAIHHLFTHSFGKSSCFTPWNYNLSPGPHKVNVNGDFFVLLRYFVEFKSTSLVCCVSDGLSSFTVTLLAREHVEVK